MPQSSSKDMPIVPRSSRTLPISYSTTDDASFQRSYQKLLCLTIKNLDLRYNILYSLLQVTPIICFMLLEQQMLLYCCCRRRRLFRDSFSFVEVSSSWRQRVVTAFWVPLSWSVRHHTSSGTSMHRHLSIITTSITTHHLFLFSLRTTTMIKKQTQSDYQNYFSNFNDP